jgi:hypothetical protein
MWPSGSEWRRSALTTDPELTDPYTVNLNLELTETPPGKYLAKVVDLRLATGPSGYAYYDAMFVVQEPLQFSGCRRPTTCR